MTPVTTIFFDIGGVLLTNAWDRHSRRRATDTFGLDWDEYRYRHDAAAYDFETGRMTLDQYLHRTVFYEEREFSTAEFVAAMKTESKEIEGALAVVADLSRTGVFLATLNNESLELNEHRIETFGLRDLFEVFLSSCYLGVKKPEEAIYRLAFQITQRKPEQCLFVDDRPLNLECARDQGLDGILFRGATEFRADLQARELLR
ncbi:MAG: HAD family hydrolase [Acidimicrobiia bacterium]